MSDEKTGFLPPDNTAYNPHYGAGPSAPPGAPGEGPPAYSAAPVQYPPPQPMAPAPGPEGYNPYQHQAYAAAYPPPGAPGAAMPPPMPPGVQAPPPLPPAGQMYTPAPYPGQQAPAPYPGQPAPSSYPVQLQQPPPETMVVQVTPQVRSGRGYRRSAAGQPLGCCRRNWTRKCGFCCGFGIVIVSTLLAVGAFIQAKSDFIATKDFQEGTCQVDVRGINNDTMSSGKKTCTKPNCKQGRNRNCDTTYDCYSVIGRVHYTETNHSDLVQMYANSAERGRYGGDCSYRPPTCRDSTEHIFTERNAFKDEPFSCFYSTDPLRIYLIKNQPFQPIILAFPGALILIGIVLVIAVKFCGHMFSCPSESQALKKQQQQAENAQQMQPLQS